MTKKKDFPAAAIILMVKFTLFVCFVLLMWYGIDRTVTLKYKYDSPDVGTNLSAVSSSYSGFYDIEEDTIDVLLFGSSHMGCGINPQDMYDAAEIRSYNLASNSQPIWISYYWLKEALQYQSPGIVILDCYQLFLDESEYELPPPRMALDNMRNGQNKLEASSLAASLIESESSLSYSLNTIRYHDRWSELMEDDFIWFEEDPVKMAKGFYRAWSICDIDSFVPLDLSSCSDSVETESFNSINEKYLDKIVELCESRNIELILIKTPTPSETIARHITIQNYADEHNIIFYDFNVKELYEEIDFDYGQDMHDTFPEGSGHANPSGARKMSYWLAEQLVGVNGVNSVKDEQWEESRGFNEHCWQNFYLLHEEDLTRYLEMLDQDRYSIFISARDDASSALNEEVISAMRTLGFSFDLEGCYRYSYIAIKDQGEITELLSEEASATNGALNNGSISYFVTSAGMNQGDSSSIKIGGKEYSVNSRGLNIVVYDNEIKDVIDSVCFDTYSSELAAIR